MQNEIEQMEGQTALFDLDIWCGKMFPEHSAATKEKTSQPSLKKPSVSQSRKLPMCLCLRKDGATQELSWETDGALLGELMMRNIGEFPNEENASRLSQILEENPHPKYFLSAKACQGILNRAAKRGKDLPKELKEALRTQSELGGGCDGGGKGALVQEEKSGTLGTGNDQTVFCIGSYHSNAWKSDNPHSGVYKAETARTLDALNCGYPACNQGEMAVVQKVKSCHSLDEKCANTYVWEEQANTLAARDYKQPQMVMACDMYNHTTTGEIAATLNASSCSCAGRSGPSVMTLATQSYTQGSYGKYIEGCGTLRANMGDNQFAVCGMDGYNGALTGDVSSTLGVNCGMTTGRNGVMCLNDQGGNVMGVSEEVIGALCADDHKGINNQYVEQGKCVVKQRTVRRLTPLECERLQGFPDNWTNIGEWIDSKGKKHECSDSARYKALGNSIALPFWRFLCKRISAQYARKATMASLFDGIGGFPLVWEEWNGKGSAVWASEKDDFPMAVTKYHFKEGME